MEARNSPPEHVPWYRIPVLWLGIVIFAASIAGCIWIIVVSLQYRDEALAVPTHSVLGVPAHSQPAPASS